MSIPTTSPTDFTSCHFDYLIIGGGTAGLVVAARLSEDPSINVGVLEAGSASFDLPSVNVPGRYGETLDTPLDWQYHTTPQAGLGGRSLPWPRGKVLGGTSALNFMTWNRPNREDLDAWERLGNKGWGWDDVLPFYKKSENFIESPDPAKQQQHEIYYNRDAMGVDGPLHITYLPEYSESHAYWHKTLNQLGLETNKSHLSGSNVGVWTNAVSVDPRTTTRSYATPAYYLPNAHRPNLRVLTDAAVRGIVLEQGGEQWTATGVRFDHAGQSHTIAASREVILSAGSVASPQLLELSGIGNPSILERAGIEVKVPNRNVGENIQEHMMTATIYEIDPSIQTPEDLLSNATLAAEADKLYETTQSGPRAILPGSICYVPFSHFTPRETLADIAKRAPRSSVRERILADRLSLSSPEQRVGQVEYIFDVGNWSPFLKESPSSDQDTKKKYATLLQILQYPFSRGSVHISPSDAHGKPTIDPQYYTGASGALDLTLQLHALRFGQKLVQTEPLAHFIKGPAWPVSAELSDEELRQWVVDNTITDWHPVGSCAMGGSVGRGEGGAGGGEKGEGGAGSGEEYEGGVVDERLRVYGVRGLRVVDASVMPLQISAHLQATVYAIAEKGSVMIKEDQKKGAGK